MQLQQNKLPMTKNEVVAHMGVEQWDRSHSVLEQTTEISVGRGICLDTTISGENDEPISGTVNTTDFIPNEQLQLNEAQNGHGPALFTVVTKKGDGIEWQRIALTRHWTSWIFSRHHPAHLGVICKARGFSHLSTTGKRGGQHELNLHLLHIL